MMPARAADTAGVCQSDVHSLAGSVLIYASQIRYTLTLFVCTANDVTWPLQTIMITSTSAGGTICLKWMFEAVSESQYVAGLGSAR